MRRITPTATTIDGIPAFVAEQPASLPFFAGLMIRAGWGDETLKTCGLTHLVEHLALPARHLPELELNGLVQDTTTLFWFSGEREAAIEQLLDTARALCDLPLERLESERSILFTEQESRSTGLVPLLKSLRFGARGYGLSHYEEHALRWVQREHVADWAARHFTRANACLYVVGELPDSIGIELPEGSRISPLPPQPIDYVRYPAAFGYGPPATIGVSFLARRSVALMTAMRILEVRLRDTLRHQHGVTYASDWVYEALTGDDAHVVVWADAMEANVDRVRNVFLTVLDELAFAGPTQEELERDGKFFREQLADPLSAPNMVFKCADDELLRGVQTTDDELLGELDALSPQDVAEALTETAHSMLLCVPQESSGVGGRFNDYPMEPPARVSGRRFKRRRTFLRRAQDGPERELIVGPEGVTLIADGFTSTVQYENCVALLRVDEGQRGLWSADGFYVYVDPAVWSDGERLVAEIDAGVPAEVVISPEHNAGGTDLAAGEAAFVEGRWADAIEALRRGLEQSPDHALAWTQLAFALEAERRYPELLEAAERAVAADGRLAAAHRARARGLRFQGQPLKAAEAIRVALTLDPSDLDVLSDYAWLVGESGARDDAMRAATRAVELYPDEGAAWFALASAAEAHGDAVREEEALRKMLELEPKVAIWHNNLGWFRLRNGQEKEAIACFERALKLEPDVPFAARNRALALALLGREAEARRSLAALRKSELRLAEANVERNPEDVDSLAGRATLLVELGRVDEAARALDDLERGARDRGRPDRLFDAAALRLDLGDADGARRLFDEALGESETSAESSYYRAYAGAHFDDRDAAFEGARQMRELHGSHPYTPDAAGYAAFAAGDPAEALERFTETLARQPLRCCSHAWRGIAVAELGDGEAASQALSRARTLCMRGGVHCASVVRLSERVEQG